MEIINTGKIAILKSLDGYMLKNKQDNYIPKSIDEEGNEIQEHIPYYFDKAYVPKSMTLDQAKEMYEEINIDEIKKQKGIEEN